MGSNRSQTEVHERSLDNKIAQADKRLIQFIVNDQLFPLLRMHGYKIDDNDHFEFKTAEQEMELPALWNITNGLITNGYEVQQEWISKTFNIPIEGKKKVHGLIREDVIVPNSNARAMFFPNQRNARYDFSCNCGNHVQAVGKPTQAEIDKFTDQLAEYIFEGKDTLGIEAGLISSEANLLLQALRDNFKTFNAWEGEDHLMLQMMEYNLFEFAASKTESRLAAMTDLLFDENKEIRSFSSFRAECDKLMEDYNHNWLETEYNLSIAVGQNSARYVEFMSEKDTVTSFVKYQTAGDDRVRTAHQALDGKVFNLNDPAAMDLWPPNGFGCRCEMVQYLGDKTEAMSGEKAKNLMYSSDPKFQDSQFEINRGNLKQVFTNEQFYANNKKMTHKINDMTFDKYMDFNGDQLLKPWADFKENLKDIKLDKTITGENVKELFKKVKGKDYMGFEDYADRKMTMSEKTFKRHTVGKYLNPGENRHQLFPHIKEILNSPDEVWYNNPDKLPNNFHSRYVKFYGDMIIAIDCETKKNGLEIKTWYKGKKEDLNLRKGLLIRNKVN